VKFLFALLITFSSFEIFAQEKVHDVPIAHKHHTIDFSLSKAEMSKRWAAAFERHGIEGVKLDTFVIMTRTLEKTGDVSYFLDGHSADGLQKACIELELRGHVFFEMNTQKHARSAVCIGCPDGCQPVKINKKWVCGLCPDGKRCGRSLTIRSREPVF